MHTPPHLALTGSSQQPNKAVLVAAPAEWHAGMRLAAAALDAVHTAACCLTTCLCLCLCAASALLCADLPGPLILLHMDHTLLRGALLPLLDTVHLALLHMGCTLLRGDLLALLACLEALHPALLRIGCSLLHNGLYLLRTRKAVCLTLLGSRCGSLCCGIGWLALPVPHVLSDAHAACRTRPAAEGRISARPVSVAAAHAAALVPQLQGWVSSQ